jgi:tetratricopeptide (TPR) repeat protein
MKKFLFGLLMFAFSIAIVQAQDEDPTKALKRAGRALSGYNIDPVNNADKLKEATEAIEFALTSKDVQALAEAWQKKGEIYNAIGSTEARMMQFEQLQGKAYKLQKPGAPLLAFEAFKKAMSLAQKKYETKDAVTGIKETVSYLNAYANVKLTENDFEGAFPLLDGVLDARKILMDNGEKDMFQTPKDLQSHQFAVGYCATIAQKGARAKEIFKELYDGGYDEPRVYSTYFRLLDESNDPGALTVLEKGRMKYPDNSEILFAEINHYIKVEKYDVLELKLKEAIAREPNNPSVYSALGNVYMNLHNAQEEANNHTKAEEYFDQSLEYYNKALAIDPNLFEAIYSIGSNYFNKAVEILKEMNKLGMSKDDQKKYDVMSKEVDALFEQALPYFKKGEKIDPNDRNTLIALKEIFARKNDLTISGEFKKRLETIEAGGKIEKPFFNN